MQIHDFDHYISRHKIFKVNPSPQYEQQPEIVKNKLVIRDSEVFYAVGSSVRCGHLSSSLDYKVFLSFFGKTIYHFFF